MIIAFCMILFLLVGAPVALAIAAAALILLLISFPAPQALYIFWERFSATFSSHSMTSLVLFVFSGVLIGKSGIARRLLRFALLFGSHVPGYLAQVTLGTNFIFGTISGSETASAVTVGSIVASLNREARRMSPAFLAAINIAAAPLALLIPPSKMLNVYAFSSAGLASKSELFLAGYVPGLLMLFALGAAALFISIHHHGWQRLSSRDLILTWPDKIYIIVAVLPLLGVLVALIMSLSLGFISATEDAFLLTVFTVLLSFVYREMTFSKWKQVFLETTLIAGPLFFLLGFSSVLSWDFAYLKIPQSLTSTLEAAFPNKYVFLLFVNMALLVVGMLVDIVPASLMLTPIFLPVAMRFGISPVQFGIIEIMNLSIGLTTPPLGMLLYVGLTPFYVSFFRVLKYLAILWGVQIGVLLLVSYIPVLSLGLSAALSHLG